MRPPLRKALEEFALKVKGHVKDAQDILVLIREQDDQEAWPQNS